MSNHTPGPWKIEPVFIGPHGTHFGEYRFPHQAVDGHSREYPRDEAEANARLIAAAPALYDAAQFALSVLSVYPMEMSERMAIEQLEAALKLVEKGEQGNETKQ